MRGFVRVLQKPPSEVDEILADRASYIDTLPKAEAKLYLAEVLTLTLSLTHHPNSMPCSGR